MNKLNVVASLIVVSGLWIGCESKFVEQSPESVQLSGMTLDERLRHKNKVDSRINEIDRGVEKVKRIVDLFKKVQGANASKDIYTPLDFLIDVNAELKEKIPTEREESMVRSSKYELPIKELSEECKKVEVNLESNFLIDTEASMKAEAEDLVVVGERLTYSVKTCTTKGEFLPVAQADWTESRVDLSFNNKNLETIFRDLILDEAMKSTDCSIKQGKEKIIEELTCTDFKVDLSRSEMAIVHKMQFSNSSNIRFHAIADIYEGAVKKASSEIKVDDKGEVDIDLKKIGEKAEAAQEDNEKS